jgi:hypothetical protein
MPDFLRALSNASGTAPEWVVVFTFIAVTVFYFLAPVLGYQAASRGLLLIALYLLIAYGVLVLFEAILLYFCYLVMSIPDHISRVNINIGFLMGILRLTVFIASQVALVLGLRNLRRTSDSTK